MMLFAKPPKPERGTARSKRWMAKVAASPCVICGYWPVIVHHCIHDRYAQRRASDLETISLCQLHHDELHAGPASWRERYGRADYEYIPLVRATIRTADENTI